MKIRSAASGRNVTNSIPAVEAAKSRWEYIISQLECKRT